MINMYEMFKIIEEKALENSNIYIVCSDGLDKLFFPKMVKSCRERIIACGISEQNQVSLANGIALQGKKVYCLMMNAFLLHRALDQVKMACYSNCDIKFIGFSSNIIAMEGGYSHISIDDIAILKTTPNLEIYDPYTLNELKIVMEKTFNNNTPMYIACTESSLGILSKTSDTNSECGYTKLVKGANDFCIITSGDAVNFLFNEQTIAKIAFKYKMPTIYTAYKISPFDTNNFKKIVKKYKNIMTFEVRGTGALSSSVAEIIAQNGLKRKFLPVYFDNEKFNIVGYRFYPAKKYLELANLPKKIKKFFAPFGIKIFSSKNYISDENIIIKHKFIGITYYKQIIK